MANAGNQVCPCFTNQLYTYSIGTILTLATVGGTVTAILGGVLNKPVSAGRVARLQFAPSVGPSSMGMTLGGSF
jgi:hypothetical protein